MKATTNAARKNGMREQKEVKEETYMSWNTCFYNHIMDSIVLLLECYDVTSDAVIFGRKTSLLNNIVCFVFGVRQNEYAFYKSFSFF